MSGFGWDYPPGVTGREPQIAGYPPCGNCGHEAEAHGDKPDKYGHGAMRCNEPGCNCTEYDEHADEVEYDGPDPEPSAEVERREEMGIE